MTIFTSVYIVLFILQIIIIFFISRITIKELYLFLYRWVKNEHTVLIILSILFFPGTVIHEMSHFLIATILLLRVREVHLFPHIEKNSIRLGYVLYEKKDAVRGIIVGVAPFFGAVFFFLCLSYFKLFPSDSFILTIAITYIIFITSTMMFSSQKDLSDSIIILPLIIIGSGIVYVFNIDFKAVFFNTSVMKVGEIVSKTMNTYLLLSLSIHFLLILLLKSLRMIRK